jgi:aconitate hydratase
MGLLPLEFLPGNGISELGIEATDLFTIKGLNQINNDHKEVDFHIQKESGDVVKVKLKVRLDNPDEVIFWKNGGILQTAWKEA